MNFTECESCGYFTLTFLGICTNAQCLQPKTLGITGSTCGACNHHLLEYSTYLMCSNAACGVTYPKGSQP